MRNFVLRVIIYAIAIAIVAELIPGINVINDDIGTLLIIGLVFGIVNALLKPILVLLTCPAVILTLGLFILVINGVMLMITSSLIPGRLQVEGLGAAILGGIVMSIVSMVLEGVFGLNKEEKRKQDGVVIVDRR